LFYFPVKGYIGIRSGERRRRELDNLDCEESEEKEEEEEEEEVEEGRKKWHEIYRPRR